MKTLEELLVLKPKRPICDVLPATGMHRALAVVRYRITKQGQAPMFANVCRRDERGFIERAEKAGFTLDPIETWG